MENQHHDVDDLYLSIEFQMDGYMVIESTLRFLGKNENDIDAIPVTMRVRLAPESAKSHNDLQNNWASVVIGVESLTSDTDTTSDEFNKDMHAAVWYSGQKFAETVRKNGEHRILSVYLIHRTMVDNTDGSKTDAITMLGTKSDGERILLGATFNTDADGVVTPGYKFTMASERIPLVCKNQIEVTNSFYDGFYGRDKPDVSVNFKQISEDGFEGLIVDSRKKVDYDSPKRFAFGKN